MDCKTPQPQVGQGAVPRHIHPAFTLVEKFKVAVLHAQHSALLRICRISLPPTINTLQAVKTERFHWLPKRHRRGRRTRETQIVHPPKRSRSCSQASMPPDVVDHAIFSTIPEGLGQIEKSVPESSRVSLAFFLFLPLPQGASRGVFN